MWVPAGEGHWTWTADADVHLLLLTDDGVAWELHGAWLHRYRPARPIPTQPLEGAEYLDSSLLDVDAPTTDDEGWGVLASLVSVG